MSKPRILPTNTTGPVTDLWCWSCVLFSQTEQTFSIQCRWIKCGSNPHKLYY